MSCQGTQSGWRQEAFQKALSAVLYPLSQAAHTELFFPFGLQHCPVEAARQEMEKRKMRQKLAPAYLQIEHNALPWFPLTADYIDKYNDSVIKYLRDVFSAGSAAGNDSPAYMTTARLVDQRASQIVT